MNIKWIWKEFEAFSVYELYEVLKIRQDIFIIEQECIYDDLDNKDQDTFHLMGYDQSQKNKLIAYLRIHAPNTKYTEASIGRICNDSSVRGMGLGKIMTAAAIEKITQLYSGENIRIEAQAYLEKFYNGLGFKTQTEPYDPGDGIQHIQMVRFCNNLENKESKNVS